jgi:glycine cleavage system regulatory protein
MQDVILTIVGTDRPGLVEALAEAVATNGGNWLESRMAHLAGTFAGLLHVQAPADAMPRVVSAVERLAGDGLKITVERGTPVPAVTRRALELDIVGLDRAGIVRDISRVLVKHGANIEELVTNSSSAPMSGELLFRAEMRLTVSEAADLRALRSDLEEFATDLMVELRTIETMSGGAHPGALRR